MEVHPAGGWTAVTAGRSLLLVVVLFGCEHPPHGPTFVDLGRMDSSIEIDMRYAGSDNFVGSRIDGYLANRCLLVERAARAVIGVQRELSESGLGLLVYDCYRPQRAVDHFVRWANDPSDDRTRADYHPAIEKPQLIELGYIAMQSGHSRGSTIDLTLIERGDDGSRSPLDMGTSFDFFDAASNTDSNDVTEQQRLNRQRLRSAMERGGFQNFPKEWWHYTLRDEFEPDLYWDVPID